NQDAANTLARLLVLLFDQDVRVAHDGNKALGLVGEFRPEIILLDIGMPGMDGYEGARRLKALPARVPAILVAMAGRGPGADDDRSRQAGCDRSLVKPVDLEALKGLLRSSPSTIRAGSPPDPGRPNGS